MKRLTSILSCLGLTLLFAFTYPNPDNGYSVGDVATDFSLQNAIDDSWVSLSDYEDVNGYIVIFTCNTCPYAVMYEDRIIDLHNTFAPQGYPVVAINPNDPDVKAGDSYTAMKERADDKDFPFPYLLDAEQAVFPVYGATRTPHVFLLDNARVVHYIGAIDDNPKDAESVTKPYVAMAIEAIEKGETADPSETVAIGCTIKVKS